MKERRFVNIRMKYDKGRLILKVDNPFKGDILLNEDEIITTKKDNINHGIGLKSVKTVLEKYDGSMKIEHRKDIFSITLLMYID